MKNIYRIARFKMDDKKSSELESFYNSEIFKQRDKDSYSEYWHQHAKKMKLKKVKNGFITEGESGWYIPETFLKKNISKILRLFKSPKNIIKKLYFKYLKSPRYLSPQKAFDAVMNHDIISDPDISTYRVNHLDLAINYKNIITNANDVNKHYSSWNDEIPNYHIYMEYYYRNLLIPYIKNIPENIFLEIGAGSGNFANLLIHDYQPRIYFIVDLPESIVNSFIFLTKKFKNLELILPDRFNNKEDLNQRIKFSNNNQKVIFLTPWQISYIPSNFITLTSNLHSFQEMKFRQIENYFSEIQRISKNDGLFFCSNRVEKIPCSEESFKKESNEKPNIFYNYPWNSKNTKIIQEISKIHRLIQSDNLVIRLERIKK